VTKGRLDLFLRLPAIVFDGTDRDPHKKFVLLHTFHFSDSFHFRFLNEDLDYLVTSCTILYFGKNQHNYFL